VHTLTRHTRFQERRFRGLDHGLRAADEDFVHTADRQQGGDDRAHLVAVDPPLKQVHFLGLARQNVDQCQAVRVAVLEILQGLVEHHAVHAPVAKDQGELGAGLLFQGAGHDRKDGRDP
jgi:hypothetical protein